MSKTPTTEFFSGPFFLVFGLNMEIYLFSPNTGKYGPEKTLYLDTFQAVVVKTGKNLKIKQDPLLVFDHDFIIRSF